MESYGSTASGMIGREAVKVPTLTNAIEDFDGYLGRAQNYAERLHKLAERVNGPRPTEAGATKDQPNMPSMIAALQQRRAQLGHILDGMERALEGLERGL